MNSDFKELLQALHDHRVDYLVVGGYAVIYHAEPRFTKDLDLWIRPTEVNAARLMEAFRRFGMPLIDIVEEDFTREGTQYVMGVPPVSIDFLTSLPGLSFEACWIRKANDRIDDVHVHYLGREDLIVAKKTADRDQDRIDVRKLGGSS